MICVNEDHYPTDRPLTILTIDPRLHFPDEHGPECIDIVCPTCAGAGKLPVLITNPGPARTRRSLMP